MAVVWRVDELAQRKGWNARRLAEKAGIDVKTARNILTGRATRVDLETIGRISDALGVEPGQLWRRGGGPRQDRWASTAGAAGVASKEEIDHVLGGHDRYVDTDPALERATRSS